eukprot:scaffold10371_cov60-Cyclotella_meneghiniana.AAC.5
MMFGIDTKQSKLVSHEAVNSQTEPNSPRNEARHSPITVLSRRGKGNGDGGVVRFAVFADLTVGKMSFFQFFPRTGQAGIFINTGQSARREFELLDSDPKRLKAVKEQISICCKGFGWEDVGHYWSKDGYTYTSRELFDHFVNVVLEAERTRDIPTEPDVSLSVDNCRYTLGTMTALMIDERFVSCKIGRRF